MAANTSPIYVLTPNVPTTLTMTTANTAMDGTGTSQLLFTAGTNGSFVQYIRIKAQGTNAATVFRVFLNNGASAATASNNSLIAELSLPATTGSNSTANPDFQIPLNIVLPASYRLYGTEGTATASGIIAVAVGGDY